MRFLFSAILLFLTVPGFCEEPAVPKVFFANSVMPERYFYSKVSYSAPAWVNNIQGNLPVSDHHFTPGNSLMLQYTSAVGGAWQVHVYYHRIRGLDRFEAADQLVFRLHITKEVAGAFLPEVGIGQKDQAPAQFVPVHEFIGDPQPGGWITVAIPLTRLTDQTDIHRLDQLTFRNPANADGKEHTLYVDQIELTKTTSTGMNVSAPVLASAKGYEKHVDITWDPVQESGVRYIKVYRSNDNKTFYPVGIQVPQISRYADFVDTVGQRYWYRIAALDNNYRESSFSKTLDAQTRPLTDDELLDMVQEAHFRYYWEGAEKHSGLALENIPGRRDMVASGASGFGVMAIIVGVRRGFISRSEAVERFRKIVSFLNKAEKFHGAFSHFIDGPTGKVEPFFGPRDNGGDLVETSFLMQGLLTAAQYFDGPTKEETEIRSGIDKLWRNIEWSWYRRTKDNPFLIWHWSPNKGWIIDHKLIGWNETMITYFLAISSPTHGVPASMYYTGWASQSEQAQQYRMNWGKTTDGSKYVNGNSYYGLKLPVGVSNGGPLFFVHYSYLGLDPRRLRDAYTDYFTNNRNIALINHRYCVENPEGHRGYGADCWGLTASDGPWGYSANEPVPAQDQGKMTPTGALASFPYTPDESMAALKNYYRNMGHFLWDAYGFRDAFNLDENWCSEIFMGLNQAPVVVMIENYRSGVLWNLFIQNKDVKKAIEKISLEKAR